MDSIPADTSTPSSNSETPIAPDSPITAEPPIVLLHPNRTNARVWDFVVERSTLTNRWRQ